MEGRVAHHVVETDLRAVGADVALHQIGFRVEIPGHLVGVHIQLAAVNIGPGGRIIEEIPHAAGQVGNQVMLRGAQTGHDQLAQGGGCEKLPVFKQFFLLTVRMVAVKIFALQSMQAADPGVGVKNILPGDTAILRTAAVNQVDNLLVQFLALIPRNRRVLILIFHSNPPIVPK